MHARVQEGPSPMHASKKGLPVIPAAPWQNPVSALAT